MSRTSSRTFGTSVFAEMTALATRHEAVNLGQGFPDFDGPAFVKEAAAEALAAGHNQYAAMPGLPALRRAIVEHQRRFYGIEHDAENEVTVHAGATEAICATLLALVEPGDEVIVFEPFYDAYLPCLAMAQATARPVGLVPPGFRLDAAALEAAVGPRTRAIIVNSPGNPAGCVLTPAELEAIADVCRRHDLVAITDEVYEHIVFEGRHLPLATLPGMRERTVTISSSGKTFSLTGWKIGWSCAPPRLSAAIRAVHQYVVFAVATPFQHAIATALAAPRRVLRGAADGVSRPPRSALPGPRGARLRRTATGGRVLRARRHPSPRLPRRRGFLPHDVARVSASRRSP